MISIEMETRSVVFRGWDLGKESDNKVTQGKFSEWWNSVSSLYSSKHKELPSKKGNFTIFILYFIYLTKKKASGKSSCSVYSKFTYVFWANVAPDDTLTSLDVHAVHSGPLFSPCLIYAFIKLWYIFCPIFQLFAVIIIGG